MSNYTDSISNYIDKSAPFAQTILTELRSIIHTFCPEVNETLKWGMPFFTYRNANLCHFAAFKQHCALGFWLHTEMKDDLDIFKREQEGGMGSLGKLQQLSDLPSKEALGSYIIEAMQLIEKGVKLKKKPSKPQTELVVPDVLLKAFETFPVAKSAFDNFSPSHKREYINWLNEAKTEATLLRRLDKTIANLLENKSMLQHYQK